MINNTKKDAEQYDCGILNFWWGSNYGAVLTCYALQESIKDLGFVPRVINYVPRKYIQFKGGLSESFSRKYLDLTERCSSRKELMKLNGQTGSFIVGSDQVWRFPFFWPWGKNVFQLSFAAGNKKKIAYAVSFGTDHFEGGYQETRLTEFYIRRFDNISVREKDGIDICRNTFGVEAVHVLDPVFLAGEPAWRRLIDASSVKGEGFIASYVLDKSDFASGILKKVKEHFVGLESIDMKDGAKNMKIPVEDWLCNISRCRFFVTDSFHGACFALIFQKPFICIANRERGRSRFDSLFAMLGLQKHCVSALEDLADIEAYDQIDYQQVSRILKHEAGRSREWLREALISPRRESDPVQEMFAMLLDQEEDNFEKLSAFVLRPKYRKKYYRCKIMSWITFGRKRKKYRQKCENMKLLLKNKIDLQA